MTRLCVLFASLLLPLGLSAQPMDRAEREQAIDRIATLLMERYVYADVAERCAAHLKAQQAAGSYESFSDAASFARALTDEMRTTCGDRHFEVGTRTLPSTQAAPADPNAWIDDLRRRNYDFYEVRRLPGNIGYLDLRSFPPPDVAAATAAGAMAFLASSDAVIIDLRRNSGGTGDMVLFLASYFFDQTTRLSNTIRRSEGTITQDRTLPWVPGQRLLKQTLFILTSEATFSAAEGFAFSLQSLGRAVVVGEKTKGGANAGRWTNVSDHLRVFISNAHATSAATGKSWDKVGVAPDIPARFASALAVAHDEALKSLLAQATSVDRRTELQRVIEAEQARRSASAVAGSLAALEGTYGLYDVRVRDGRLTYSHDTGPRRTLLPLDRNRFAVEEIDGRVIEFRDGALVVSYSDGTLERHVRSDDRR